MDKEITNTGSSTNMSAKDLVKVALESLQERTVDCNSRMKNIGRVVVLLQEALGKM